MMSGNLYINVSAIDYDRTSEAIRLVLTRLQEMVHLEEEFAITDSEFAFGWHFFVVRVNRELIESLASQMGPDFDYLKGKGPDKKFLTWLTGRVAAGSPRFKLAIKEEMESSKFGIF